MSLNVKQFKPFIEKTLIRIRNFLTTKEFREFLILMFFIFISFLFWMLDTLKLDFKETFDIPVRLVNVPENVIVTSEPTKSVKVTVSAKGTDLLNYKLGRKFSPISIDFNQYETYGESVKLLSLNLLQNQFNAATRFVSIVPDSIAYVYSANEYVMCPVYADFDLRTDMMHAIGKVKIYPDSVKAYIPDYMSESEVRAETEQCIRENLSDTLDVTLDIKKIKGVKFVPDKVRLVAPVEIFLEETMEVPISGVGFPIGKNLRTFPTNVRVTFQAGMSKVKELSADDFTVGVDYDDIARLSGDFTSAKVEVKAYPEGVKNIRIYPEYVDFLIEDKVRDHDSIGDNRRDR